VREPVEASGTSGSCPEASGRQWKSVEDKEGVGRGSGGSGEVQEVRRRSGRPWKSAEEAGKAREVMVRYIPVPLWYYFGRHHMLYSCPFLSAIFYLMISILYLSGLVPYETHS